MRSRRKQGRAAQACETYLPQSISSYFLLKLSAAPLTQQGTVSQLSASKVERFANPVVPGFTSEHVLP